jgi:uncharacterized protein (TIGR02757 family)
VTRARASSLTSPLQSKPRKPLPAQARLRRHLDGFLQTFPKEEHLASDPVQFVHRYSEAADREVVGFIASAFAYGNVRSVLRSVEIILDGLGAHPADFVTRFDPARDGARFLDFRHRWNDGRDLITLFWILGRLIDSYGSLENAVVESAGSEAASIEVRLDRFSLTALSYGHERFYSNEDLATRRGVRYFFPRTSHRSACKRLNLFLRWMVRAEDGIDCGVWTRIAPHDLVIPVDTHISRISQYIGLTEITTPGWKMAQDITESLRILDPSDPLRYDFALCHLGIAGNCPKKRDLEKCGECPIRLVCRL